jgi:uncharacterized protein YgbK (DUF1537 family)
MLVKAGMRTVQMIGVPKGPLPGDIDAVVVALKTRTCPVGRAVAESLSALGRLREAGCRQFYFKYCSTFDSTPTGNIGPAFPANGRTVYKGHLFVGDALLSDSGMRHHPLTPMTDANLVRVLGRQVKGRVGLVDAFTVARGPEAIRIRFDVLRGEGFRFAVVDALSDDDLLAIGAACADLPLVTAGSGVALGLPQNFRRAGLLADTKVADACPSRRPARGRLGSCSVATQGQVAEMRKSHPLVPRRSPGARGGRDVAGEALSWAKERIRAGPVLVYATDAPESVRAAQERLGAEKAGAWWKRRWRPSPGGGGNGGRPADRRGGETAGAVVKALGIDGLRIGPEIDPGVPWTSALGGGKPLALALKSGNFGTPISFLKAWGNSYDRREQAARGDRRIRPLAVRSRVTSGSRPATSARASTTATC